MDRRITDNMRERSRRPIRSRRYNRRTHSEDRRPRKRLFTPEIKRYLKDWLIRRRDNPYPNRDEKKTLAVQTGLTYVQVCNWFANWRRKLKNSGQQTQRSSWGNLIKSYNTQIHGNVEHFSICSEDSIWEEGDSSGLVSRVINKKRATLSDNMEDIGDSRRHCEANANNFVSNHEFNNAISYVNGERKHAMQNNNTAESQYYSDDKDDLNPFAQNTNKYKNHIMEKYLRDCQKPDNYINDCFEIKKHQDLDATRPSMISKWRESAENFKPSERNYLNWTLAKTQKKRNKRTLAIGDANNQPHGKEELDAAEALTTLANAHSASGH